MATFFKYRDFELPKGSNHCHQSPQDVAIAQVKQRKTLLRPDQAIQFSIDVSCAQTWSSALDQP